MGQVQAFQRRPQITAHLDKLPVPQSIDAEEAVLGGVFCDASQLDVAAGIAQPGDFQREQNRLIFAAMIALRHRGEVIDLVTVADELRADDRLIEVGGASYLAELIERVPTSAGIAHHAAIVRRHALRREVIERTATIAATVAHDARPMADYLPEMLAPIYAMPLEPSASQPLSQTVVEAVCSIEAAGRNPPAMSTGFAALDEVVGGWFPGSYVVVGARTAVGKSSFVLATALAAAMAGRRVAYFSLEIDRQLMAKRALAQLAGVGLKDILRGTLSPSDMTLVNNAAELLASLPLQIEEDWQRQWPTVQQKVRRVVAGGAELVVIDYLGLLDLPSSRGDRREKIGAISHDLKALANFLGVPIITPAQINREAVKEKDSRPKLHHLRDAGDIEQDAGVVLLLHRPALSEGSAPSDLCEVTVAKQSNGPTGDVRLRFIPWSMGFAPWEAGDSEHFVV